MGLCVALAGCGGAGADDGVIDREALETYSEASPLVLDVSSARAFVIDQAAGAIDAARVRLRDDAGRVASLADVLRALRALGFEPEASEDGRMRVGDQEFREPRLPRGCEDRCEDARVVAARLCYTVCSEPEVAADRSVTPPHPRPGDEPGDDRADGRTDPGRDDRTDGRTNPGGGDRDGGGSRGGSGSGSGGGSRGGSGSGGGRSEPGDAAGGRTNPGGGDW
jgi:hypothetical protein